MRRKGLLGVVLGVVFVAGAAGTAGALKHTVCVETSESPGDPFCWEFDDGTGNPIPTGGGNGGNGNGQGGGGGGDGGNKCDAECKKKRCEDTAIEKAAACSLAVDFMFDWCVDEWGMSQAISWCTTAVGSSYMAFGFNGQPRTQIREHSHTCYLGERGAQHDWGYGCGECPACSLRAKGWREYAGNPSLPATNAKRLR